MAPFFPPNVVVSSFKERAEALTVQGAEAATGMRDLFSVSFVMLQATGYMLELLQETSISTR